MNQRKAVWLLVTAMVSVLLLIIACDDDKPTEPTPPAEPKDYAVYSVDASTDNWIFGFHPLTNALDSFYLTMDWVWGLEASSDGSLLYVAGLEEIAIVELSQLEIGLDSAGHHPDTLEINRFLPYRAQGGLETSPDGQLLAVFGRDDLYFLSTSDYSVQFSDTDQVSQGYFSRDSRTFYGAAGWEASNTGLPYVYRVDLSDTTNRIRTGFALSGSIGTVIPSNDESLLFFDAYSGQISQFVVYSQSTDSVLYLDAYLPGNGMSEITPDGRYVFYCNSGSIFTIDGPSYFIAYDVEQRQIHDTISTLGLVDPPYDDNLPMNEFEPTPDNRWLVGAHCAKPVMITLDLETLDIARVIDFRAQYGRGRQFLTCQNGL